MSKILIALRTHIWNDDTQKLTFKLYSETRGADFVVLFDETQRTVDTTPFEKVSHTADMTPLGLPTWPVNTLNLHYNGDYALYALRKSKPDYDFYLMLEGDAAINIDILPILQKCIDDKIDFIGLVDQINDPNERHHFTNTLKWLPNFARSFFPFIAASGRFIDSLYEKRLNLKEQPDAEQFWPYCEAFVGSFLVSHPEFKFINLHQIADVSDFTWLNHKHTKDPRAYIKGTIVHPITSENFVQRNLSCHDITNIFIEDSTLFTGVRAGGIKEYLPILEKEIKHKKDHNLLIKFWNFALQKRWIDLPHPINIAFSKPTTQSSVCSASKFSTVEEDSALLVDGFLEHTSRSHTDYEKNPWVMIDLAEFCEIRTVLIYVRPDCYQTFCDFRVDLSIDGKEWSTMYQKIDGIVPDAANMKPIVINVNRGFKTRFLKIIKENEGWLHLNQVEVYTY